VTKLSVSEILDRAAAVIEPEGAWTQGVYAKDAKGHTTSPVSRINPPVCFCMLGAVMRAAGTSRDDSRPLKFLELHGGYAGRHWAWNDSVHRTQPEVVAKLREAASLAREKGL